MGLVYLKKDRTLIIVSCLGSVQSSLQISFSVVVALTFEDVGFIEL